MTDSAGERAVQWPSVLSHRRADAGRRSETPWTTLQLACFVGTAMWTYLTRPFTFTIDLVHAHQHLEAHRAEVSAT
jgi:hypothetical protein